jgi:hypothetical protein
LQFQKKKSKCGSRSLDFDHEKGCTKHPLFCMPPRFPLQTPGQRESAVRSRGGGGHGAPTAHTNLRGDNLVAPRDQSLELIEKRSHFHCFGSAPRILSIPYPAMGILIRQPIRDSVFSNFSPRRGTWLLVYFTFVVSKFGQTRIR